jgi:hypothetical protein
VARELTVRPDEAVIRRQNQLFDHYTGWVLAHPGAEPDDDPEYVERAREIMGLPPLQAGGGARTSGSESIET